MAKRRSRKGSYKYTAKRRAALKKAQNASARKRKAAPNKRKSNTRRNIAIGVSVGALTAGGIVARHRLSGSTFSKTNHPIVSGTMKKVSGSRAASLSTGRLSSGRQFSYHSRKQGPLGDSFTATYSHEKLTMKKVLGATSSNRLNSALDKRRNRRLSREHFGTQGVKPYLGPRKYVGNTELFTEIGANGKVIRKGFTTIGSAYSGVKG